MNDLRARLEAYMGCRLLSTEDGLAVNAPGLILLREIISSVFSPVENNLWNRRPSISDDGTPVIISWKSGTGLDDSIRILAESGTLRMTVAEQITYTLTKLDRILGLLNWRDAAEQINSITKQVLPAASSATLGWRGGIWLGAEVKPGLQDAELRLYINLRHGDANERWRKLLNLISSFSSETINPFLCEWHGNARKYAIPVGLGVVISKGRVRGIRAYISVENPSVESIEAVIASNGNKLYGLRSAHESFISHFGNINKHSVTAGCDFFPGAYEPSRMKADICCHLVPRELSPGLVPWISGLLGEWSFNPESFNEFMCGIKKQWYTGEVQFLSLGFKPGLEHATVYIKPSDRI